MRATTVVWILASLLAGSSSADSATRTIPEHCLALADEATGTSWNDAYGQGFHAIQRADYTVAEERMCRALLAARDFGPRDWRFAETLDELGRIAFQLRDFELAERMQGAAIAEMLLAAGPHGEPLHDRETAQIRPDCRSGLSAYTTRLGWIHERVSGRVSVAELESSPWLVFEAGYLPLDGFLAERLDWLVSQYLLEEHVEAAAALTELQRKIANQAPIGID